MTKKSVKETLYIVEREKFSNEVEGFLNKVAKWTFQRKEGELFKNCNVFKYTNLNLKNGYIWEKI